MVIGFLTGQWRVKFHLNKMGIVSKAMCRWCDSREETTTHLMCKCPAFTGMRQNVWGRPFIEPQELRSRDIKSVLGFIRAIDSELRD